MVKRIVVLQSEDAIAEEIYGSGGSPSRGTLAPAPVAEAAAEGEPNGSGSGPISLRDIGRKAARDAEREALRKVLYQTNWNRKKAARILEVSYKTLLQKIKDTGLGE